MDGVIVLDKPAGISSHDAVQRARRITGIRKIGHLGTLDPLGTGVLPLVVGAATRLARFFSQHKRVYEALFRFGVATDTYDADGEPAGEPVAVKLTRDEIERAMAAFQGKNPQTPPAVSAKKVEGVPAYKLARQKKPVKLEPVEVEVYRFELLDAGPDWARVRVECSMGTYVRSLAHDLGQALGCGAHVAELRRAAAGEFTLEQAVTLEQLEALAREGRLAEAFLPAAEVLRDMPSQRVDAVTAARIAHGRDFRVSPFANLGNSKRLKAIGPNGRLLAIAEARLPHLYHPIVVL